MIEVGDLLEGLRLKIAQLEKELSIVRDENAWLTQLRERQCDHEGICGQAISSAKAQTVQRAISIVAKHGSDTGRMVEELRAISADQDFTLLAAFRRDFTALLDRVVLVRDA